MAAQDDEVARFVQEKKLPQKIYFTSTCCTKSDLLLVAEQVDQMLVEGTKEKKRE